MRLASQSLPPKGKRGFSWRRPRHRLKAKHDPAAVDRIGLRLQLSRAQAPAGDIILLFADQAEALTYRYLAHAWARRGADLRIEMPGKDAKVALLGAQEALSHELVVITSPTKHSADVVALLDAIEHRFHRVADPPVVLVLDNGPVHTGQLATKALAQRPWLTVEWLPKYTPELNDIERAWRDLKQHHLAHQTFADPAALDQAIHRNVEALNRERLRPLPCDSLRICA